MDLLDAGVHDHFYAHQAGLMRAVDRGARDLYSMVGGLDDGVLFGVQRALAALAAVYNTDQASYVVAVGHARGAAVVAGREDAFVAYDHGAHGEARACGAGRYFVGYTHEVFVPRGTDLFQGLVGA